MNGISYFWSIIIKLIFLDIDGVLNSRNSCMRNHQKLVKKYGTDYDVPWHEQILIDNPSPIAIKYLNWIIKETKAQIVISSTWRDEAKLIMWNRYFAMCGLRGEVCGVTKNLQTNRGREIDDWINDTSNINIEKLESFVILDDDNDMEPHMDRLVLCSNINGLTSKEAQEAIKVLGRKYE
jgi:hypothetical protein